MMKTAFVLLALLCGSTSWGQVVRSLYQDSSFVPSNLLPFQVKGDWIADGGKISKVLVVTNSESADCRAMIDPFHSNVFLLKCMGETIVSLNIQVSLGNMLYAFDYGPLEIKNPAEGLVVVDPGTPDDPDWTAGKALFSRCIECHTANQLKGKKAAEIATNTLTVGSPGYSQMNPRTDIRSITAAQRLQIEKYLANPTRGK